MDRISFHSDSKSALKPAASFCASIPSATQSTLLSAEALAKLNSQKLGRNHSKELVNSKISFNASTRYATKIREEGADQHRSSLYGQVRARNEPQTAQASKIATSITADTMPYHTTHKRFLQHRETIQQTLIRKFKAKYIDSNPEFQVDLRPQAAWNSPIRKQIIIIDDNVTEAPEADQELTKAQQAAQERALAILSVIVNEVAKFLTTKRITNSNIQDLDKKIGMEIYLKEKKEAIIEDRKEVKEADTESNLAKVRAKYTDLVKSVEVESQFKRSQTMSQQAKSICGSI